MPKYDITVRPIDGNAFNIMGAVRRALRKAGASDIDIREYTDDAMSGNYDHLLQTSMEWVDLQESPR